VLSDVQYTRSGDVAIAYQVLGDGPPDVLFVPPFVISIGTIWENDLWSRLYRRLGEFSRLVVFDKRGIGLSDRVRDIPTLETRVDDIRAVADAVGLERSILVGPVEGAAIAAYYAASYPERTRALVMLDPVVRGLWAPDFPWTWTEDQWNEHLQHVRTGWGDRQFFEELFRQVGPSLAGDPTYMDSFVRHMRLAASPGAAVTQRMMQMSIDVRQILPAVRVPTLVLRRGEFIPAEVARYTAGAIPDSQLVEVPGVGGPIFNEPDLAADQIRAFIEGLGDVRRPETVLATVLFTDIVGSTARAAELGDARWMDLLARHHALVRRQLDRFRGQEIDTAGDGFFASFDGPLRAIRCACAIRDSVREVGLEIRSGLHAGECEVSDGKIGGIAVHIGARVAARAEPGEVLVTSTVKDLVAGSGTRFEARGSATLKGVPDEWQLHAVTEEPPV